MSFTIRDSDESLNLIQSILYQTDLNALADAIAGNGVVSGCTVSAQVSPNMTVEVAAGEIQVNGARVPIAGGTVNLAPADPVYHRLDIVYAVDDGSTAADAGVATQYPKAVDYPAASILLAMVYVPAQASAITASHLTDKRFLVQPLDMGLELTHSVAQTIPHNTWTALTWNTVTRDTDEFESGGTVTIPADGFYTVTCTVSFLTHATGRRGLRLALPGPTYIAYDIRTAVSGDESTPRVVLSRFFSSGDVLSAQAFQNSGDVLDIPSGSYGPQLIITRG